VLVDQVNSLRASGMRLAEAAREASISRVRPVFLTTITTFLGLVPMIFSKSIAGKMTVPLAITMAFGVLIAAVITMFLVPCLYLALEDVMLLVSGTKRTRSSERSEESREGGDGEVEGEATV
jgi:multidrug efflux pump subunit AcrB